MYACLARFASSRSKRQFHSLPMPYSQYETVITVWFSD